MLTRYKTVCFLLFFSNIAHSQTAQQDFFNQLEYDAHTYCHQNILWEGLKKISPALRLQDTAHRIENATKNLERHITRTTKSSFVVEKSLSDQIAHIIYHKTRNSLADAYVYSQIHSFLKSKESLQNLASNISLYRLTHHGLVSKQADKDLYILENLFQDNWSWTQHTELWSYTINKNGVDFDNHIDQNQPTTPGYKKGRGGCVFEKNNLMLLNLSFSPRDLHHPSLELYMQSFLSHLDFEQAHKDGCFLWLYQYACQHLKNIAQIALHHLDERDEGIRRDFFYKVSYFISSDLAQKIWLSLLQQDFLDFRHDLDVKSEN